MFEYRHHSKYWKTAVDIIFAKQGKSDYSALKLYRIISLLNTLSKVLKELFAARLGYYANIITRTPLLHSSQIGGWKQQSAVDAALLLQHYVEKELKKHRKKVVTTVFIDVKGAFN